MVNGRLPLSSAERSSYFSFLVLIATACNTPGPFVPLTVINLLLGTSSRVSAKHTYKTCIYPLATISRWQGFAQMEYPCSILPMLCVDSELSLFSCLLLQRKLGYKAKSYHLIPMGSGDRQG